MGKSLKIVLFGPITPRLVQKGSRGSPRVDFGSILDRRMREIRPNFVQSIDMHSKTKQKMEGVPPRISYFWGCVSTGRVPAS